MPLQLLNHAASLVELEVM